MPELRRRKQLEQNKEQPVSQVNEQEMVRVLAQLLDSKAASAQTNRNISEGAANTVEINWVELFWRILNKFYIVLIGAVLGTLITGIYAYYFYVPQYTATSKLYIVSNSSTVIDMSALNIGTALATDYKEVFMTHEVSEMAIDILKSNYNVDNYKYTQLQKMLTVSNPDKSRVIYLTVVNPDPELAQQIADSFALAGQQFITERMRTDEPTSFSVAMIPGTPSTRSKSTYVILGFVIGTCLALAGITIAYITDDKPRTSDDIFRVSGLTTLGILPLDKNERESMKRAKARRDKRNRRIGGSRA